MSKNNENNSQNQKQRERDAGYSKGRYTSYQNKIRLANNDERNTPLDDNEVVLAFPYKDCVLTGGMTKEDKNKNIEERFLHLEIDKKDIDALRDNKVLTNFSVVDINGEKKVTKPDQVEFFDEKGNLKNNLLIKGNNLISLYSLREQFVGKIKMIYIDPPYNTGGEANIFTYNNSFNHASWLAFMRNRLEVAKRLLRDDGIIAVAIDDFENAYLKVLLDEIFERENFIGTICIETNPGGRDVNTFFATSHEYCHFYARDYHKASIKSFKLNEQEKQKFDLQDEQGYYKLSVFRRGGGYSTPEERPNSYYPIYYNKQTQDLSIEKQDGYVEILPIDSAGKARVWRRTKPSFMEAVRNNDVVVKYSNNKYQVFLKDRLTNDRGKRPKTMWYDSKYSATTSGTMYLRKLIGENRFSYPKSFYLINDILSITTEKDDIILDFFAGSGTTGHATLALNAEDGGNRKFIMCEQIDEHFGVCKERITKVLQKSEDLFNQASDEKVIACELKKYNQEYIDQIRGAKTKDELKKVCERILSSSHPFLQFDFIKEDFDCDDKTLSLEQQKAKLVQVLDVNQLYHNQLDMKDRTHNISQLDQELTNKFYGFKS